MFYTERVNVFLTVPPSIKQNTQVMYSKIRGFDTRQKVECHRKCSVLPSTSSLHSKSDASPNDMV